MASEVKTAATSDSTSFLFPTTLQPGMLFDNVQEIKKIISLEALERNIQMEIYSHKVRSNQY